MKGPCGSSFLNGTRISRKVAEGICGSFCTRFAEGLFLLFGLFAFLEGHAEDFAEGPRGRFSRRYANFAEGFCGKFLQEVLRKVLAAGLCQVLAEG